MSPKKPLRQGFLLSCEACGGPVRRFDGYLGRALYVSTIEDYEQMIEDLRQRLSGAERRINHLKEQKRAERFYGC